MKKIRYLLILFCSVLLTIACNREKNKEIEIKINTGESITIFIDPGKPGEINIRDIIDTVLYIPLETSPEVTIGSINKIIFTGNRIFIADIDNTQSIYCFSKSGEHLFSIKSKGRGPGQYSYFNDFDVDPGSERVFVNDNQSRALLLYDFTGKFISRHIHKHIFGFFSLTDTCNILAYSEYITNLTIPKQSNSSAFIFDYKKGKDAKSLLAFNEELSLYLKVTDLINNISVSKGINYIYDYYTNAIYAFSNNTFTKRWELDFGKKNIPANFWESAVGIDSEIEGIEAGRFCSGLLNFQVLNKFIVGYYNYKSSIHTFIYDKEENMICTPPYWIQQTKSDIPVFIIPPFHTDGDNIVIILEPVSINNMIRKTPDEVTIPPELKNIDINSNPVLQIIKLK